MNERALKAQLTRTWDAFFSQHGRFTAAQVAAIPPLLAGANVMLCAATASGKTAAALAPLIDRHLPPLRVQSALTLLYLLPTRALVSDLFNRLQPPLERLRVSFATKTRDLTSFDPRHPADLLLTTPESLDSLMATEPRILNQVRAVIIDEIHAFDGSVRGDQLRILLNRLRQIRRYAQTAGDAEDADIQFAALSATVADPVKLVSRYFLPAEVVSVGGNRAVDAMLLPLEADDPAALLDVLKSFRERGWRKCLVFCNRRAEVEAYAEMVRRSTTLFGEAVFVHYSNLDRQKRHEIETQFATAQVAVCFASSTLELGIDIGSIDVTLLIGAPGSAAAFHQRIGRAARRQSRAATVCFYRTELERLLFEALLASGTGSEAESAFHLSVVIQQIFSLIKQSRQASVRLSSLDTLLAGMVEKSDVEKIVGELTAREYLQPARAGEWRAGAALNRLVDQQGLDDAPLSLHSNIENSGGNKITIRESGSQRVLAHVDWQWLNREHFTLEGRRIEVQWSDGESIWVSPRRTVPSSPGLSFRSGRQGMSYMMAQALARRLGILHATTQLVQQGKAWLWFHWLGDIYGHALLDLLRETTCAAQLIDPVGICLELPEKLVESPRWTEAQISHHVQSRYRAYEGMMAMGAYQALLPLELRRRSVLEHFDAQRFLSITARWSFEMASEEQSAVLVRLVDDE